MIGSITTGHASAASGDTKTKDDLKARVRAEACPSVGKPSATRKVMASKRLRCGEVQMVTGRLTLCTWAKVVLTAAVLCAVCFQVRGQSPEDTISLGPAKLTLGMSKNTVTKALSGGGLILQDEPGQANAGATAYTVWSKNPPPYDYFGGVIFTNGKLDHVDKDWGPKEQQAGLQFAKALYGAANDVLETGVRTCELAVSRVQDTTGEEQNIILTCGSRQININMFNLIQGVGPASYAVVTEVLERR